MKKIILSVLLVVIIFLGAYFFTSVRKDEDLVTEKENSFIFGLATGTGGLGDKAFNDMQFNGMLMAKRNYRINFIYDSPNDFTDAAIVIQRLIDKKASVIIAGGGFHMVEPVDSLARVYPEILFIILDDLAREYLPNVASLTFKQNEGSFLAGAIAAMESKSNKIAMIGAINHQVINDFYIGYEAGAEFAKPGVTVIKEYIENYDRQTSPFANPQVAFEIANQLYNQKGVDVIFQVASGSGMGVFNAARLNNSYAIGVDSDQDYLAEGYILTSMMKRLDTGIEMIVGKIINNEFENKPFSLGLKENGISLSEMKYTKDKLNPKHLIMLENIKNEIIDGLIKVPSTLAF